MKLSIRKGLSFGLASSIITTLGLIVGLQSSTNSRVAVISGILIIAVADTLSDALAMHMSEESDKQKGKRDIWESTGSTFVSKFFFAMTFLVPVALLPLYHAIIASIAWGLLLIILLSIYVAKIQKENVFNAVASHVAISIIVVVASHYIGKLINTLL